MKHKQQHQSRRPFSIIEDRGRFYISPMCCYVDARPEFECGGKKWKIIHCNDNLVVQSTCGQVMKGNRNEMLIRIKNKGYVSL